VSVLSKSELKSKRVAVLMGGLSAERDVSLRTGAAVSKALRSLGYDVVDIDVGKDLAARLVAEKVDVAWLALHGRYGEDGCVQGLLESLFIPYTGSGVLASAMGMEKVYAKQVFTIHGIPTPPYKVFTEASAARAAVDSLPFPFPVVVKPSREGSSVGVHVCKTKEAYLAAVDDASKYAGFLLVEQFIKGREVQGAVLDDEALGVSQVHGRQWHEVPLPSTPARRSVCARERGVPRRPQGARLQGSVALGRHRHRVGRGVRAGNQHAAGNDRGQPAAEDRRGPWH
jgi:D-alanine-D-alanine ligase